MYFCFSCFDVSPSALWKALVALTDQFECYLLVEKQGSDCSKHITLEITSCYVLMKPSYVELTGHKTKSLKKKQLTTVKPPGKGWFWTVSCWVNTYIGLISCGVTFIKSPGIIWTDVPISCDNAFKADQLLFTTSRVQQQQQNTHYTYTHDLYTHDTHEKTRFRIHMIHVHIMAVT